MKVLFVNPACLDQRVTDDDALKVPIGLYYLAARLLDHGIQASILNLAQKHPMAEKNGDNFPEPAALFKSTIEREKPDIIGFSVTNPSRINAMACARAARNTLEDCLIVFGGPAPTFMSRHLFKACPELDIIVKGEGEVSFLALAKAVKKLGSSLKNNGLIDELTGVPGLIFRLENEFKDTGPAQLINDLDSLGHPSRYFIYEHLSMSRGCPGKCTFCGSPKFWGRSCVRRHSADWFYEEIQTLAEKGVSHFYISDDTFTMDAGAVIRLCEKIIQAGLSITWNAISRVDYIDESILGPMRRAGCIQISFGVESGSEKIKKILGKPIDNETCIKAFDLVKSYGILPRAYFIYGSPGESRATVQESISLMERLAPLGTVCYMLVVFPGTYLYTRALEKKWVNDDIWHKEIEDLPWFELDPNMDFLQVKSYGDELRQAFFKGLDQFIHNMKLKQDPSLFPFHADFLSRLALTFSHGEYARDPRVEDPPKTAKFLFEKALEYHPDPRAYLGLAMGLQKTRDFPGAMALLETGLKEFPDNKDLSICMGICLMNQGNFRPALTFFTPFDKDPGLRHYIDICNHRISS